MSDIRVGDKLRVTQAVWELPRDRTITFHKCLLSECWHSVWLARNGSTELVAKVEAPLPESHAEDMLGRLQVAERGEIPNGEEVLWRNGYAVFYDSALYRATPEAPGLEMIPEAWAFTDPDEQLAGRMLHWQAGAMRDSCGVFPGDVDCYTLEGGTCCLIYPFVPGRDLASVMRDSPRLVPGVIVRVIDKLRVLSSSLGYHQDLKPEHILVLQDGDVRLLDPGYRDCGGEMGSVYPTVRFQTTPRYYPLLRYSLDDRQALAVILYEWLTGDRPFGGAIWDDFPKTMIERPVREGGAFSERELQLSRMRFVQSMPRREDSIPKSYWDLITGLLSFTIDLEGAARSLNETI